MPGRADEELYTRNLLSTGSSSGKTCYLMGAGGEWRCAKLTSQINK